MNLKQFFVKNWFHFFAIAVMFILTTTYFSLQFNGYGLKQHDIEQWKGMSNEVTDYRDRTGEEALWTNSMFGGMPATQISVVYDGNYVKTYVNNFLKIYKAPAGIVLYSMIGFYILMMCMRINRWVALLGAISFGFTSYGIIIIQAGHVTKALAAAFMAPVLGAFIMAYQRNLKWGIILSALFMSIELGANHVQVTYYFAFLLMAVGIVFFIKAIQTKTIKRFLLATAGIIGAYALAGAINYGNLALTNDYSTHTTRGGNDLKLNPDGTPNEKNSTAGLERDYVTQWSYGIGESFTLISPYVKGGGSVPLSQSPFAEDAQNLDISTAKINGAMNYPVYWGDQPITSGPVYVGIVVFFLALLGLFFLKNPMKWAIFAVILLTLALSWGKNFMGLTDFFLDHIPGYNKFRAVTIILIVTGLCIPILGAMLLDMFVKERENLMPQKKRFFIISVATLLFLVILKFVGLGDGYVSEGDKRQMDGLASQTEMIKQQIRTQLLAENPEELKTKYNLDVTNPQQIDEFVNMQAAQYIPDLDLDTIKEIRKSIFNSSVNRSILFLVFSIGLLSMFFMTKIDSKFIVIGLIVLVAVDLISVSWNYLGSQYEDDKETSYRYWDKEVNTLYPIAASSTDEEILQRELSENPELVKVVEEGRRAGRAKAEELGFFEAKEIRRIEDLYKLQALGRYTNYRVFDINGGFNSANTSYFHKSLGGYHGAKLRNIQNLFDFHLSKSNNKVYDMLNVKYFVQKDDKGQSSVRVNPNALGNAWLVKKVNTFKTPDEEILALGNQFELKAKGVGQLLVNGVDKKQAFVYGNEKLQYVLQQDTINVPLANGLTEGIEAVLVMDVNGKTDFILKQMLSMDTAKSFLQLVEMKVTDEFKPREEAIMLASEAASLSNMSYSGEGTIKMTAYAPNKLTYEADVKNKQLAVFSEIYYADGWKAYIDGKEAKILKVDYLLRGLELPEGKHKIEFVYDLPKFHRANTIASIGCFALLLLLAGGIVTDYRNKKKQTFAKA